MASTKVKVPDYSDKTLDELWADWKVEHKKTYENEDEETRRFEIFKSTKETVEAHNEKYKKGEESYVMGLNQFADRKPNEVCCGGRKGLNPPPPPPPKNLGRSKSTV